MCYKVFFLSPISSHYHQWEIPEQILHEVVKNIIFSGCFLGKCFLSENSFLNLNYLKCHIICCTVFFFLQYWQNEIEVAISKTIIIKGIKIIKDSGEEQIKTWIIQQSPLSVEPISHIAGGRSHLHRGILGLHSTHNQLSLVLLVLLPSEVGIKKGINFFFFF